MLVIAVVSLALALHHADRRMRVLAGAGAMAFVCVCGSVSRKAESVCLI